MINYPLLQGLVKTKVGSVGDLAMLLGKTRNYTSLLLNGKRKITLELAEQLVGILGLDEDDCKYSVQEIFFSK